ncbi:MAG: FecR domain-containing protein [Acidobacteriia bacterium]|nr:FecR domain-containing protein [Terriglobia bacterium]
MSRSNVVSAISLLLVLVAGLLIAPSARADSQVRIVRLSLVDGPVQIDRATGQGLEKAIMNMPITQGVTISTQNDGRAEIEFEDGTTMRLAPETDVIFSQLGLRSSGARVTAVEVTQGTAYFNVRHKGDDEFRVAFANREIRLDRNVHFRLDLTGGNPEIAVFKGELSLNGPRERAKVKKNETLTLDLADSGRYDLAKNIATLSYDEWDNERIDYASQYASSSYNTRSPYYYGASDLNYYGSWSDWSGYGMLWRPFGVGFGWDPFDNGAWAWYPGFGYTWVSTYPWGWTPYRYGSWVFIPNFGWGWRSGGWNTWYTVPPVYNPPVNFHVPRPPLPVAVVGGRGAIGPHPTVVVDNGVGVFRTPRPAPRGDGFSGRKGAGAAETAPAAGPVPAGLATGPAPTQAITPLGSTSAAPATPAPVRDPRSHMRRGMDQDRPIGTGRGAPAPHVERNAPPAPRVDRVAPPARVERSAPPAPRVERSAPPAPRMAPAPPPPAPRAAPPSGGGHFAARSPK